MARSPNNTADPDAPPRGGAAVLALSTSTRYSPAAGLQDVFEILYAEHGHLLGLLAELEAQGERLGPRKIPDFHLLGDILHYLHEFPDRYHHPRQALLYRLLAARDTEVAPAAARLAREHRTLDTLNTALVAELETILGGAPAKRPALAREIAAYVAGYRAHIAYESDEVFPRARGRLSAAELRRLARRTRYTDDPLFGGELLHRYRRVGRRLRVKAEVIRAELTHRELSAIEAAIAALGRTIDIGRDARQLLADRLAETLAQQEATLREYLGPETGPLAPLVLPLAMADNHWHFLRTTARDLAALVRAGREHPGKGS